MTTPPREPRVLIGIGFMMLAATLLPVMNGLVSWLVQRYPAEQVIWARIAGHAAVMLLVMLPDRGLGVLATRRPGLQVARSLCQVTSTSLYFAALVTIPLAKAAAIGFIGPFLVALMAWPMLGERPQLRRILTVCAGFLGVLVVMRPGGEAFQPGSLLILGSATAYALYQVLTRKVAPLDRPDTSALYSGLVGGVLLTLALPLFWVTPTSLLDAATFLALGALGAAGHYCVALAFARAPATVIAPFQYWQIVGAVGMGVALTGFWPDAATWAGTAIIIGAGIFLAVSEGRRR